MSKKSKRQARKDTVVSTTPGNGAASTKAPTFNPDYTPVIRDLRRIAILAGTFVVILVTLSFFLR